VLPKKKKIRKVLLTLFVPHHSHRTLVVFHALWAISNPKL
jgi:hypothetical protein